MALAVAALIAAGAAIVVPAVVVYTICETLER